MSRQAESYRKFVRVGEGVLLVPREEYSERSEIFYIILILGERNKEGWLCAIFDQNRILCKVRYKMAGKQKNSGKAKALDGAGRCSNWLSLHPNERGRKTEPPVWRSQAAA